MSNSRKTKIVFPLLFPLFVMAWLVFIGSPNICAAAKKRFYRVVKSVKVRQTNGSTTKVAPRKTEEALLGLTVWKLRPAGKDDPAKELIEEEQSGQTRSSEYTLERMETDAPLTVGERIRLSVESLSHSGYLYVVERELYSDGTYSSPKLIYPTLRTVNRKNPVGAGNLIFIPEAPRYFRIKSLQTEKKQTAEVLTIIVSPTALIDQSMLQTKALDLPVEQFTEWLKNWEVDTTLLEQVDGAGQAITPIEQSAGQDSAKALTEESVSLAADDPIPQSVFRSKINRGNPVLVNVLLEFRSN